MDRVVVLVGFVALSGCDQPMSMESCAATCRAQGSVMLEYENGWDSRCVCGEAVGRAGEGGAP